MKLVSDVHSGLLRAAVAASVFSLAAQLAGAETVSTTLNLVSEAGFNELALSLQVPAFETGNDTSTLTGTTDVTLEIDPRNGVLSLLTFTGGSLTGAVVSF